jgi:hypothetical protein
MILILKNDIKIMSLHGSTWVVTENGPKNIKDLRNIGKVKIFSNGVLVETNVTMSSPMSQVYKLKTNEGFELIATGKTLLLSNGNWVAMEDLKQGQTLSLHDHLSKRQTVHWSGDTKPLMNEEDLNIIEMKSSDFCKEWLKTYFRQNIFFKDYDCIFIRNENKEKMQLIQRMLFRFGILTYSSDILNENNTSLVIRGDANFRFNDIFNLSTENFEVEICDVQKIFFAPVYTCTLQSDAFLDANGFIVKF